MKTLMSALQQLQTYFLMGIGKVFVTLLIIGLFCVLVVPTQICNPHDTSCAVVMYIGLGLLGICGLIFLYSVVFLLKECCKCLFECCLRCCWRCLQSRRIRIDRDRLLDNGELQQDNYSQDLPADEFPPPFFEREQPPLYEIQEEWEQDFRQTFHQQECTICLEAFYDQNGNITNEVLRKRCGHKFHRICINDWLQRNDNCPICRKAIS